MLIIIGESASGKSTVEKILCNDYGYKRVISYTTRQPREYERDGIDYHFVSDEKFLELKEKGFFAEYAQYNGWWYGSSVYDCTDDKVAVLTPHGMRSLKKVKNLNIVSFYLRVSRKDRLVKIIERGDNIEEAYRRSVSDCGQFDGVEDEVDFIVDNDNYNMKAASVAKRIHFQYADALQDKGKGLYKKKLNIVCNFDFEVMNTMKASSVITELMKAHNFYFVGDFASAHTINHILGTLFPLYNSDMLIICKDKYLIHGDVYIDHEIENLNDNMKLCLLFDTSSNQDETIVNPSVKRVYGWEDIKSVICKLQKE